LVDSTQNQQLVLVIGAGPAGLFTANKLAEAGKRVVILNRDIKPGGLAEYGIFVSKHKMKEGLRKQFRKILANPNIDYYGNVTVGTNGKVSLEELKNIGFDAIVFAAGAQGTKKVGIEGEESKGIYHAKDLVYHYNHLPPFSEKDYVMGDKVAIIGVGNVMVDIAHWLVHTKNVKEVVAIARRGPNERAYTDKEMKAIAFNMDKKNVKNEIERIRPVLESINQNADQTFLDLTKDCNEQYYEKQSQTKFSFKFLCSPKRVVADENNNVVGLEVENNTLIEKDGKVSLKALGTSEIIPLDNVVFAIGDTVDGSLGLPVNKWGEFVKNEKPYENDPQANLYEVATPDTQEVMKGYFVVGWSRKASDGLVGIAKKDGETGTKYVLDYLSNLPSNNNTNERLHNLTNLFKSKNVDFVNNKDVGNLEEVELAEAQKRNLEFYKFDHNSEMLDIVHSKR
jgi:ferredoxin--NADP+ reductase